MSSDSELVQRCRAGDQAAWSELCERFARLVYSIPRRYGFSAADAEDVMQTVFTRLFEKLEMLKDPSRLPGWLSTTTHRLCWESSQRSVTGWPLDPLIVDVGAPAADQLVEWERQRLVHEGLRRLGGQCEELLTALFGEPESESSYQAVARRLGMKVGSIGPARARCFEKLARILARLGLRGDTREDEAAGPGG